MKHHIALSIALVGSMHLLMGTTFAETGLTVNTGDMSLSYTTGTTVSSGVAVTGSTATGTTGGSVTGSGMTTGTTGSGTVAVPPTPPVSSGQIPDFPEVESQPSFIFEQLPAVMQASPGLKTWVLTPGLDEFAESLAWMYTYGITSRQKIVEFDPGGPVNRFVAARFLAQWIRAIGIESLHTVDQTRVCSYSDIVGLAPVFQEDIVFLCQRGFFEDNEIFDPYRGVTRADFIGLLLQSVSRVDAGIIMDRSDQFATIKERSVTKASDDSAFNEIVMRREVSLYFYRMKDVLQSRGLPTLIGIDETGLLDGSSIVSLDPKQQPEFIEARNRLRDNQLLDIAQQDIRSINPYAPMTRAELAHMIHAYMKYQGIDRGDAGAGCEFTDLQRLTEARVIAAQELCRQGIMGVAPQFRPQDQVLGYVYYTVLMRAIDGKQAENITPRYRNYLKKAQSFGLLTASQLNQQDRVVTLYEAIMTLYQYDLSSYLLKQLNSDLLTNQLISTLEVGTGATTALISIDMSLLTNSQFEEGFTELLGTTYSIRQQAIKRYYPQAFARYGSLHQLDNNKQIGSAVFAIAQGRLVRGSVRLNGVSYTIVRDTVGSGLYRLNKVGK